MESLRRAGGGITVADVPGGGGVAFRALRPDQDVRYLAGDLSPKMPQRARRRAEARSLRQVETLEAEMTALPFADGEVDLFLLISGLHMVPEPQLAVAEIGRCLKPGGQLPGTTFLDDVSAASSAFPDGLAQRQLPPWSGLRGSPERDSNS